jgi:hypothetical protein
MMTFSCSCRNINQPNAIYPLGTFHRGLKKAHVMMLPSCPLWYYDDPLPHAASGWRIHCGVEVTESTTGDGGRVTKAIFIYEYQKQNMNIRGYPLSAHLYK